MELLPGSPDTMICLRISSKRLSNPSLRYEALSYTWGEELGAQVHLNGKVLKIRRNLWLFLRELRSCHDSRQLWVDAICINQNDNEEKNHQLALMPLIYRKAWGVLAWVGEVPSGADRIIAEWTATHTDERRHIAAAAIMASPYWKRTWIIQELLLARKITVYCGKRIFDWELFYLILTECLHNSPSGDTLSNYSFSDDNRSHLDPSAHSLDEIHRQRYLSRASSRFFFSKPSKSLGDNIKRYRDTQCKDPRDKVYALLSLSSIPKGKPQFVADYDITVLDLYFKTLQYCCESADFLLFAGGGFHEVLREALGCSEEAIGIVMEVSEDAQAIIENAERAFHDADRKLLRGYEGLERSGLRSFIKLLRVLWSFTVAPFYRRSDWSFLVSTLLRMAWLELFGDGFDLGRAGSVLAASLKSDRQDEIAKLLPGAFVWKEMLR